MADGVSFIKTKSEVRTKLEDMVTRMRSPKSFLTNVAYPMYIQRQSKRWVTEGASEGVRWAPLNQKYKEWKALNFAGYPGHGMKMLIRTGRLFEAVTGRELKGEPTEVKVTEVGGKEKYTLSGELKVSGMKNHFATATDRTLHVYTDLDYATYVNQTRKLWKFNDDFERRMKALYKGWFVRGSVKLE